MENMKMMMIIGIIFIVFMAIMGIVAFIAIKKAPKAMIGSNGANDMSTAQDFLPFKDIRDGLIDLGNFEYRAIIECQSINYDLKTNQEKEMIDASFQRFLDSLTFPITIHLQTRTIDNTNNLRRLEEDMVDTVKEYAQLYDYATAYLQEMARITETIGNDKQKRKYIIVPFSDSASLTYSNDDEKYEEAIRGLYLRCQVICDGLGAMGIQTNIMSSVEIAELIYSTYHRDNYSDIDQILSGDYMNLIVDGPNALVNMARENSIVWMISELENRLKMEMESQKITELEKRKMSAVLDRILQLKKAVMK